jgi:hypothetical protein
MAADAVRKLINKHAPRRSLREVAAKSGGLVTEAQLRLWTNPCGEPKSLPKIDVVCGLATALGCPQDESLRAFVLVVDEGALFDTTLLAPELNDDERRLLQLYWRIDNPRDKARAIAAVEIFSTAP